jgi:hypothetical protein
MHPVARQDATARDIRAHASPQRSGPTPRSPR